MKKFYFLLTGIIFSIFVYGQEENHRSFGKGYYPHKGYSSEKQSTVLLDLGHQQMNRPFLKSINQELQRLDSLVGYTYDGTALLLDFKEEYFYNEDELIAGYHAFSRDEPDDEWLLDDREDYEYDGAGNLIVFYDYEFDSVSQQWFAGWKRDYVYDENNLLDQTFESRKDAPGEEWYFVWRVDYTYDENNRLSSTLEYINTIGWSLSRRSAYFYDENGNLERYELYDDDDAGGWINEAREQYMYDDKNRLVEFLDYDWDETGEKWAESDREVYTYSENDNVDFFIDYDWSDSEDNWVESWREDFSYNNNFPYEQLILPWFYHDDRPNFMNHQIVEYQGDSFVDSEWIPFLKGEFYFSSEPSTSSAAISKSGINFYPNPAGAEITFKFDFSDEVSLQVYDLAGNLVQETRVRNNKPVNIGQLSNGLYLFRLTGEGTIPIFSEKILVK